MKKIFLAFMMSALFAGYALADEASFPGGAEAMDKYIASSMVYPAQAQDNGIEGVVQVRFTVREDGSIGSIKIVRMVDPDLEQEAIRLVKNMPKWTPATENGTPVSSEQTVKISFKL